MDAEVVTSDGLETTEPFTSEAGDPWGDLSMEFRLLSGDWSLEYAAVVFP